MRTEFVIQIGDYLFPFTVGQILLEAAQRKTNDVAMMQARSDALAVAQP